RMVDSAIREAVRQGIPVVVAAGNSNIDACTQSPSGVESAVVVGAATRSNRRASFSNFGSCVHLFAPGTDIVVANPRDLGNSKKAFALSSGTSLAAPFVAGIVALILEKEPHLSPLEVKSRLQDMAYKGKLQGFLNGSPNLLAQAPTPSNSSDSSANIDFSTHGNWPDDNGMSAVAIVLMIVGIVVFVGMLAGLLYVLVRRKRTISN
ncbi:MAG: S8 family serine peptidase, partial [Proteobacteria bacterium]|nr:S8 family serine peptidase [Pseudomonadota bacterium]